MIKTKMCFSRQDTCRSRKFHAQSEKLPNESEISFISLVHFTRPPSAKPTSKLMPSPTTADFPHDTRRRVATEPSSPTPFSMSIPNASICSVSVLHSCFDIVHIRPHAKGNDNGHRCQHRGPSKAHKSQRHNANSHPV